MIILVNRGSYEIVEKKPFILKTESLGSGIAVGFINKEKGIFGLLSYIFPYRENDIELDEGILYSGETLFNILQNELEKRNLDYEAAKWVLIGASKYKGGMSFLDLPEKNLKVAESWFKRNNLWEKVIKKIEAPHSISLEVNGKEGCFEIKFKNKVERYE